MLQAVGQSAIVALFGAVFHQLLRRISMTVGLRRPHVAQPISNISLARTSPTAMRPLATKRIVRGWTLLAGACVWLACANMLTGQVALQASASKAKAAVRCELRIVWGGDVPRPYAGEISISNGSLRFVRNLSLQQDSIGKISNATADRLALRPHSSSTFGGVDVQVQGKLESLVKLRIDDPLGGEAREFQVSLEELLQGEWLQPLDERGNRLAISRQVVDRLQIVSDPVSRIFAPAQSWKLKLTGNRTGLPSGAATAELRIISQTGQAVGQTQSLPLVIDEHGSFPETTVQMTTPSQEGSYRLEVAVHRRNSMLNTLVTAPASVLRGLDLVVFDAAVTPPSIIGWKLLATIDPLAASKTGSLAWLASTDMLPNIDVLPSLDMIPGLSKVYGTTVADKLQPYNPLVGAMNRPISHGSLGEREILLSGSGGNQSRASSCLSLAPKAWLALPLQGLQEDSPHRLRIRVPTDRPIELAISLQQTNALREFPPLSLDSGVVVHPRQTGELDSSGTQSVPSALATSHTEHEIVFWPRGEQAYLLLANMHSVENAGVCEVTLERAEMSATQKIPSSSTTGGVLATGNELTAPRRMVGINLDKPLLADSVSARREVDVATGRALESWATWQQSIARICQMMQLREANTLLVKGFSEGGAIFPSERLAPNCRYDSGTFFSDGRSPEIKDAVELMLQYFDRANLKLILALDLNTALPGLAPFENESGRESLHQQPLGLSESGPLSRTVRYNPLNPRVQAEIVATLRDIAARYGKHPAFAGIALQLDDQSQLIWAGDRWGYDAESLAAFEKAMQVKLPPREQLENAFSGTARLAFLEWRAAELTKFYAQLGEIVSASGADSKLYLNAIRLWDVYPDKTRFVNPDQIIRNPREYMLAFGISPEQLASSPNVELMRGSFDAITNSVNAQDWLRRESGQRGLVEFQAGADTAAVVLRYPRRFELAATGKLDNAPTRWIYPTLYFPGAHARKKLINQIFHSDPLLLVDGSWLPFSGQEDDLSSLTKTLKQLPPIKMQPIALRQRESNLCVRLGKYQNKSYLQIVNNAPWSEAVEMNYQASGRKVHTRILGDAQTLLNDDAEAKLWSFRLAPYEMIGIEIDDPQLDISNIRHSPSEATTRRIERELVEMEMLVSQAADLAQQRLLANIDGDFESWGQGGQPLGWSVSTLPQVTIGESRDLPHSGGASLLLENSAQAPVSAWAQSRPIPPPSTGRLAVQAWFRAPAVSEPFSVKLSVVGRTHSGQRFERSTILSSRGDSTNSIAIDWGRKPATLYVGDVSSENAAELSVLIELIGPGKVWVDDVQVFESFLQPDERNHLRGELLVVQKKLAEKNIYPAERLLDSHWGQYLLRVGPTVAPQVKVASTASTVSTGTAQPVARVSRASTVLGPNKANSPANMTPIEPTASRGSWSESPSVFRQMRDSLRGHWQR